MSDKPSIAEALAAVMADVKAVGKTGHNVSQNYNFRGIDAVVNAVGPVLRTHGVIVLPEVLEASYRDVQTSTGKPSRECTVRVAYTFHGPAGDSLRCVTCGEAMDSGDKGTPKAMSVAFRVALLQALCLPTDEADPDSQSYERSNGNANQQQISAGTLRGQIASVGGQMGWDRPRIEEDFAVWSQGQIIADCEDLKTLTEYLAYLNEERKRGNREQKQLKAATLGTTQTGEWRKDNPEAAKVERITDPDPAADEFAEPVS